MFRIDDTVRIKKSGVLGTIIDISCAGGACTYVVDTDSGEDDEDTFGSMTAVFCCTEEELEKV